MRGKKMQRDSQDVARLQQHELPLVCFADPLTGGGARIYTEKGQEYGTESDLEQRRLAGRCSLPEVCGGENPYPRMLTFDSRRTWNRIFSTEWAAPAESISMVEVPI